MNKHLAFFFQIFRFGVVGTLAACVHFSVVVLMVKQFSLAPLIANIAGFASAFQISYWGHRLWTFRAVDTLHRVAVPKLLLVQLINFLANETLFYIFLSFHFPYQIALFIVLTILPVFTFTCNKLWVFR